MRGSHLIDVRYPQATKYAVYSKYISYWIVTDKTVTGGPVSSTWAYISERRLTNTRGDNHTQTGKDRDAGTLFMGFSSGSRMASTGSSSCTCNPAAWNLPLTLPLSQRSAIQPGLFISIHNYNVNRSDFSMNIGQEEKPGRGRCDKGLELKKA